MPGAATAGTILVLSGNKQVVLPLTTAITGQDFTAKILGLVKAAVKTSNTGAWIAGQELTMVSGTTSTMDAAAASGIVNCIAAAPSLTGETTADILLVHPYRRAT